MLIADIKIEKHPELSTALSFSIDILLAILCARLAIAKPIFYAVNIVGSLVLCLAADRALRRMLDSDNEEMKEFIVQAAFPQGGATPEDIEVFKNGTPNGSEWFRYIVMSIAWLAYTIWYVAFFVFTFVVAFTTGLRKRLRKRDGGES